jgi:hypothetical protein
MWEERLLVMTEMSLSWLYKYIFLQDDQTNVSEIMTLQMLICFTRQSLGKASNSGFSEVTGIVPFPNRL